MLKKTILIAGGLLFSFLLNAQSQNGTIRNGPVGPSGDLCTGFNEYQKEGIPSVYPNPSSGSFTINFPAAITGNVSISVHNLMGQIIYQRNEALTGMNNEMLIKPEGITSGIYLVKTVSTEKTFTYKIVVE